MTSPRVLAAGLRAHAQGLYCPEAAAELLIAQSWLHRDDFTSRFVTVQPGTGSGQAMTVIDWPAAVAALGSTLPCSGGEQRMLRITASLADGIPVDLRDTLTSLDDANTRLLLTAIRHATGNASTDDLSGQILVQRRPAQPRTRHHRHPARRRIPLAPSKQGKREAPAENRRGLRASSTSTTGDITTGQPRSSIQPGRRRDETVRTGAGCGWPTAVSRV